MHQYVKMTGVNDRMEIFGAANEKLAGPLRSSHAWTENYLLY